MTTSVRHINPFASAAAIVFAAMMTARCGGSPTAPSTPPSTSNPPSTQPPSSVSVAVSALTLSSTTVAGGNSVSGTVTLTGAAPTGGAPVALTGTDPANVPASVMVPAGSTSASFSI